MALKCTTPVVFVILLCLAESGKRVSCTTAPGKVELSVFLTTIVMAWLKHRLTEA
ncbi:MAG: hypothetical protein WCQ95_09795 [Bacteroidota bacterium]